MQIQIWLRIEWHNWTEMTSRATLVCMLGDDLPYEV